MAFIAAFLAAKRVDQNPINKYEHNPIPSQPITRTKKLLANTKIYMNH